MHKRKATAGAGDDRLVLAFDILDAAVRFAYHPFKDPDQRRAFHLSLAQEVERAKAVLRGEPEAGRET